ncbi:MAG: trimethylamine methyltransferase family protein, partial [Albidovulum sp.]
DVHHNVEQTPWRRFKNPYPPVEILRPDQLDAIHANSKRILSEIGIKVIDGRSRSILAGIGCTSMKALRPCGLTLILSPKWLPMPQPRPRSMPATPPTT